MHISLNGWSLCVGVDWRMVKRPDVAKEKAKRRGMLVVQAATGDNIWLGFHPNTPDKSYAAALLVGLVQRNAIVYHKLSEDTCWVCLIVDGKPAVAHDLVLPLKEGRDKALEWSSLRSQYDVIGDLEGTRHKVSDVLSQLSESIKSKKIKRKTIASFLLSTNGVSRKGLIRTTVAAILVAGVGVGVKMMIDYRNAQEQASEGLARQAAALILERQNAEQRQVELARKRGEFAKLVEQRRASFRLRPDAVHLWSEFNALRTSIGISRFGYRPDAFDCADSRCTVTWVGGGRWTSALDKLRLPNVQPDYSTEKRAISVFPVEVVSSRMPGLQGISAEEVRLRLFEVLSHISTALQVDAMQPVQEVPPPEVGGAPVVIAYQGKWNIRVQGTVSLIAAGEVIKLLQPWPVRVASIKYQPNAGIEIAGDYVMLNAN